MKNILVTGAAGFIGSSVARQLINIGYNVWTIDNLSTGIEENIPDGVEFIKGNCYDKKIIESLANIKFNAIMHIAGQSSGEISFEDPIYDLKTNTESTLRLIEFGINNGSKKFIYASSMSVYGNTQEMQIKEEHPCKPLSFYAIGKLASENYLRLYQSKNFQTTSLRLFNVYGPNQNVKNLKQGMVSIYLAQAFDKRNILVKGSPKRYRDFIYIDDVVESFIKTFNYTHNGYQYYNVCTGIQTKVVELLDMMRKVVDFDFTIEYGIDTPGDQLGICGDNKKIYKSVGWKPKISLKEGLKKTTNWYEKVF